MNYPKKRYTGEKPWVNKDWLYNQYVTMDRSSQEIADDYGCKRNTVQQWLAHRAICLKYITLSGVRQLAAKPRKRKVQRLSRKGVHRKRLTVEAQGNCTAVCDIVRSPWRHGAACKRR